MSSFSRITALVLAITAPSLAAAQAPQGTNPTPPSPASATYPPAPPTTSYPGDGPTRSYVSLKLGVVAPQHDDLQYYDNGFALEGAVGYKLNENFALEVSLGRFSISGQASGYVAGVGDVTVTDDIVAYPLLATAMAVLPLDKVELFGLVGAGVYFISSDIKATAAGYYPLTDSDSDSSFAFHFGGGINVRVSPRALLGAEVKYVIGQATLYEEKGHFDSITIGGSLTFSL